MEKSKTTSSSLSAAGEEASESTTSRVELKDKECADSEEQEQEEEEECMVVTMETMLKVGAALNLNDAHRAMCETDAVLADFICGLEGVVPQDPCRASDGFYYGLAALKEWCCRPENHLELPEAITKGRKMARGPKGAPIYVDNLEEDAELKKLINKLALDFFAETTKGRGGRGGDGGGGGGGGKGEEPVEKFEWEPHGLQTQMRTSVMKMTPWEQLESMAGTDLNITLSKAYRELDPHRELIGSLLDNWQCPCMVVIGGEGDGKSSLLEQLIMQPLFARAQKRNNFCTRMAIHCRLRRTPLDDSGRITSGITMSVRDIKDPEVPLEGHTSEIAMANAFEFVENKMMECVELFDTTPNKIGIVTEKILVLEVRHPNLATLDVIDLPGSCNLPKEKSEAIKRIHEHQVAQDKSSGGLAMYLAVVPCSTKPTTSDTIAFLTDHGLLDKTFGVFTKCDKFLHDSDDIDRLESWMTGKYPTDTTAAEESTAAVDEVEGAAKVDGYVKLGGGWTATSVKPPDNLDTKYSVVHSFERLHIQKAQEKTFFRSEQFRSLTDRNFCGISALVAKIEPAHDKLLHGDFLNITMQKIGEKSQRCDFDLKMLGSVGKGDEVKNSMARGEVKRRLGLVLSTIGEKYHKDFLKEQVGKPLSAIIKEKDKQVWSYQNMHQNMSSFRSQVEALVLARIEELPSQWLGEIKGILNATIVPKKEANPATPTATPAATPAATPGASGGGWNAGFSPATPFAMIGNLFQNILPSRNSLWLATKEQPLFQLCSYQDYIARIIKKCEQLFDESVKLVRKKCEHLIEQCFSFAGPEWLQLIPEETNYASVTVKVNAVAFSSAIVSTFMIHTPSESSLSMSYMDVEVGGMNPEQQEECSILEGKIRDLMKARESVVRALNIPEEEVSRFENEVKWDEKDED